MRTMGTISGALRVRSAQIQPEDKIRKCGVIFTRALSNNKGSGPIIQQLPHSDIFPLRLSMSLALSNAYVEIRLLFFSD